MYNFNDHEKAHLLERCGIICEAEYSPLDDTTLKNCYLLALTIDDSLADFGYRLDWNSIDVLAQHMHNKKELIDPLPVVARLRETPKGATPLYPDFPTQIMSIDEAEYRIHQMTHYLSTYGIEHLADILGFKGHVRQGWHPDVPTTAKTRTDDAICERSVIRFTLDTDEIATTVWNMLVTRNERMTDTDKALLAKIDMSSQIAIHDFNHEKTPVAFHENLYPLLDHILERCKSTDDFVHSARSLCDHPGDIIKWSDYRHRTRGLKRESTSNRKKMTALIEAFSSATLADNLTHDREMSLRALERMSYGRFSKNNPCKKVVNDLRDNTLKGWNARKEAAWNDSPQAALKVLCERPGVMLRECRRLLAAGLRPEDILDAFGKHPKLSPATLLNLIAKMGSDATETQRNRITTRTHKKWIREHGSPDTLKATIECQQAILDALKRHNTYNTLIKDIAIELLRRVLADIDTPLKNKSIYIDEGIYDLEQSILITNVSDTVSSAWRPGMAMRIPDDAKVVRLFVFWNDESKRVDLDLHARTNTGLHVGWDGYANKRGITTSGDVTDSINAVEYIDINADVALQTGGVESITTRLHYYNAYNNQTLADVDTAFVGLLVVGDTEPDVKMYNSANVLMRCDLSQVRLRNMTLARIDTTHRCIIPLMNGAVPINCTFSAKEALNVLLNTQNAKLTKTPETADMTICVGHTTDPGTISLEDNGWFML